MNEKLNKREMAKRISIHVLLFCHLLVYKLQNISISYCIISPVD